MKDKMLVKLGERSVNGFGFGNIPKGGFLRGVYGVKIGETLVGEWDLKTARAAARLAKSGINITNMTDEDVSYTIRTGQVLQ